MNAAAHPSTGPRTDRGRPPRHDPHVVLRHRLSTDGVGAPVLAAGLFLAVLVLVTVVAQFGEVRISGWETATQLVRWFLGGVGVYATAVHLPLYVTHGRTRREVATDGGVFLAAYAAIVGVLLAVGFVLESVVYRMAGWTQGLESPHLFTSTDQYHLLVVEYVLMAVVWLAAGAMLGAAFYRSELIGTALIPVALAAVMAVEVATGPGYFGPVPPPVVEFLGLDLGVASAWGAAGVTAVASAVLAAITWVIVRDIPIRAQAT